MKEMKDSGFSWLSDIPSDWTMKRVKHLFMRKNEKAHQNNPVILSLARAGVRERDISNNEGQLAESYYNYNPVDIDDLLLNPMDLYSGANCSISKIQGVISPAYINLRAKDGVNPVFYDYYFKAQYWLMAFFSYGKGVSFDNRWTLNSETLMNYPVVSMPYEEQSKRANYLDSKCSKIDAIIEREQTEIDKLKEYKLSVITEAVTKGLNPYVKMKDSGLEWIEKIPDSWLTKKVKFLFENYKGLPITKDNLTNEGLPVISYGQIHSKANNGVSVSDDLIRHVDYSFQSLYPKSQVFKDDFIFADTSEDYDGCGNCVYKRDDTILFAGYHSIILHSKEKKDNRYLAYLFKTNGWRKQLREVASGVKLLSITKNMLINAMVILPPLNEQITISDYLDTKTAIIDAIIEHKNSAIEKFIEYKKSLIYEVVTGKKEV